MEKPPGPIFQSSTDLRKRDRIDDHQDEAARVLKEVGGQSDLRVRDLASRSDEFGGPIALASAIERLIESGLVEAPDSKGGDGETLRLTPRGEAFAEGLS